jgi:hypothetical protein
MLPGGWLAGDHNRVELPWYDDGKLWFGGLDSDESQVDNGDTLDFLHQTTDGDAPHAIDVSNTADVGARCQLIKSDDTTFLGRFGGGFSREYAKLGDGQHVPELLLGVQLEHQLTGRNRLLGAVEYAHDVTEFGRYRVRTLAAWEVLLDPDRNLSLRTGVLKSSNKAPNGEWAKTLDYNVDLIWKF